MKPQTEADVINRMVFNVIPRMIKRGHSLDYIRKLCADHKDRAQR